MTADLAHLDDAPAPVLVGDRLAGWVLPAVGVGCGDRVGFPDKHHRACVELSRASLARFTCPRSLDVVGALPRNPTGEILEKDLRGPFWEGRGQPGAPTPTTMTQQQQGTTRSRWAGRGGAGLMRDIK